MCWCTTVEQNYASFALNLQPKLLFLQTYCILSGHTVLKNPMLPRKLFSLLDSAPRTSSSHLNWLLASGC